MSEADQEIQESELANRSLFVQELLLLAVNAADEGLVRENPPAPDTAENPVSSAAVSTQQATLKSVAISVTNPDGVVNCSAKTSYLQHAKNSSALVRSAAATASGNPQHNSAPYDAAAKLPGAKR